VIPPPNVTGSLHMGHALNNTLQDMLCRFERMRGKDVLWQPGTDHAGIATQMVVERKLMERRARSPRHGPRGLLDEVWEWKAESGGVIVNQLKRLGASCDWSRERFTMDEGLSKAVLKVFVTLHKQGLIYKDKRLVNWDPKLLTAISDLEVEQVEVKRQPLASALSARRHLYLFQLPASNPDGSDDADASSPSPPRGPRRCWAIPASPSSGDERYGHLIGKNVVLPLVGRLIPIVADEYADPRRAPARSRSRRRTTSTTSRSASATACDASTSSISRQDAAGRQRGLPRRPAIAGGARRWVALHGLDRFAARKRIVAMMEERGFLDKIEPHKPWCRMATAPVVPIEPWLTDQWYVDAKTLAQPAIGGARRPHQVRAEELGKDLLRLDGEHPALVRLAPALVGPSDPGLVRPGRQVFVAETEEEALGTRAPALSLAGRITEGRALASRRSRISAGELTRDEDVLDTWFSSALWPFSTLGWPTRRPNWSATIRPMCWSPASTSSSSGSPG
jgi:valyl-tRNA synthetase